jgi:D-alanyl-D-alanine carboxypeptidase
MGWLCVLLTNFNLFNLAASGVHNSSILDEIRVDNSLPSLGVAKLTNGSFSSNVVGFRKQNDSTPVQSTDKFHLGSDTKAMTATLFAILIERGFFHWNDTLCETLPTNIVETMHPAHHNTTLDMLTSTSQELQISQLPFHQPF